MKKIVLTLLVFAGMGSAAFADELTETENLPEDKGFYVGLGYSHLNHEPNTQIRQEIHDLDFKSLMLNVGYKFNPYIAAEGKYNVSFSDAKAGKDGTMKSADLSVLSLFIKPMYPIAPEMDIYALFGYSLTNADYENRNISLKESAFSWGAGASYDLTEDISIIAEYTQFYNDTLNGFDHVVDSLNMGINYKF